MAKDDSDSICRHIEYLSVQLEGVFAALKSLEISQEKADRVDLLYRMHRFQEELEKSELFFEKPLSFSLEQRFKRVIGDWNEQCRKLQAIDDESLKQARQVVIERLRRECKGQEFKEPSPYQQPRQKEEVIVSLPELEELEELQETLRDMREDFSRMNDIEDPSGFWRSFNVDSRLDLWWRFNQQLNLLAEKELPEEWQQKHQAFQDFAFSYIEDLEAEASTYVKDSLEALQREGIDISGFLPYLQGDYNKLHENDSHSLCVLAAADLIRNQGDITTERTAHWIKKALDYPQDKGSRSIEDMIADFPILQNVEHHNGSLRLGYLGILERVQELSLDQPACGIFWRSGQALLAYFVTPREAYLYDPQRDRDSYQLFSGEHCVYDIDKDMRRLWGEGEDIDDLDQDTNYNSYEALIVKSRVPAIAGRKVEVHPTQKSWWDKVREIMHL
ncbi:MAG: hypothetical protein ACQEP8_06630 [Chlamydiota bacterium]